MIDPSLVADAIVALSYHLCGVPLGSSPDPGQVINGRSKDDPIYQAVTEGRDGPGPAERVHYSSCGDQLHAILERLGVRADWVNRRSLGHYAIGLNIVRLHGPACPIAITPPRDPNYRPPRGSLCLIWTTGSDAHALVCLGPGSDAGHLATGNYGAGGMSAAVSPGADIADSPIGWSGSHLLIGRSRRALQSVITPEAIASAISAQPDLTGCEVTGELCDALGARYDHE